MSRRPTTTLFGVFDSSKITDPSPRMGVFEGDLKYGRLNADGYATNRQDYPKIDPTDLDTRIIHQPAAPLTLVKPRDPALWKKDSRVKDAKKETVNSQEDITTLMNIYKSSCRRKTINIHLTVGKQRL